MAKKSFTWLVIFFLQTITIRAQDKISGYFSLQYNKTIYDISVGNNPSGVGLGLETFINSPSKFKLAIDITGHIYLENDKVFRMTTNGEEIKDVVAMINIFTGLSFQPTEQAFVSFVAGPSFINETSFGIKPSMGFYFNKTKKVMGKMSFINVFNRDKSSKGSFGTISFAIGFKLY